MKVEAMEENKEIERILENMLAAMSKKSMDEIYSDLHFFTKVCSDEIDAFEKEGKLTSRKAFLVIKNYEYSVRNIYLKYIEQLRDENQKLKELIG